MKLKPAFFLISTAVVVTLGVAWVAWAANTTPYPPATTAPGANCILLTARIDGATMESTRSFGIDQDNAKPARPLVDLIIKLTDANTSITRFDTTCTVSHDANATDITPQSVSVSSGVGTQSDSLIFQKASPGSANFLASFDLLSMPDFECAFAVGVGAGAAADLLTVDVRMCTR